MDSLPRCCCDRCWTRQRCSLLNAARTNAVATITKLAHVATSITILARCRHASQTLQSRTLQMNAATTITNSHSLLSRALASHRMPSRTLLSRSLDWQALQLSTLHTNAVGPDHRTRSRRSLVHCICTRCCHVSHTPQFRARYMNAADTITELAHAAVINTIHTRFFREHWHPKYCRHVRCYHIH